MSGFNRKLARDIRAHWAQVGAVILVLSLGIMMFSGPLLAQRDLRGSVREIYRLTRFEDFSVGFASAPASAADGVSGLPNVTAAQGRLSRDLLATVRRRGLTLRLVSVPDEGLPSVNSLLLERGSWADLRGDSCMADSHLASEFSLEPGDSLSVSAPAGEARLTVAGTAVSPEYLRLVRGRAEYVSDPALFGVIFARYSTVARLLQAEGSINEVSARVEDASRLRATMDAASGLLAPYNVTSAQEGSDRPGTVALDLEIGDIGKVAIFFSVLLLAVAALALYITMTRIVLSQQREIGITRALGYPSRSLLSHYLGYGATIGLAGGLVGVAAGCGLSRLFTGLYVDVFGLPLLETGFHPGIALAGLGVGLLFSAVGAVVPARHAVRMKPAEAIRSGGRPGHGEAGSPAGGQPRFSGRVPTWLLLALRNLGRNPGRTVLACLGVAGTICLLVTAAGGRDSIDGSVDRYVNGVLRWRVAAAWQSGPAPAGTLERVERLPGVTAAEPAIDAPGVITFEGRSADVQVQAFRAGTVMHGIYPAGGRRQPRAGELVLNRSLTRKMPVRRGDTVSLSTVAGSLPFRVAGFVSEPIGGVTYADLEYVQGLVEQATGVPGAYNTVLAQAPQAAEGGVERELRALPGVSQVVTRSSIARLSEDLLSAIRSLLVLFYALAFAMGFATLFSMTTVNLLERSREVATMRTLGAGRGRLFSFVTVESLALVAVALIPGILLGALLEWVLVSRLLTSERLAPETVLNPSTVLLVVGASLALVLISELPATARLWRMDLAKETKQPTE